MKDIEHDKNEANIGLEKASEIKKFMIQNLEERGMLDPVFLDMVDEYCELYDLRKKLQKDIKKRGLRYEITSGNGFTSEKPNESVGLKLKTNLQMTKILNDLGIKQAQPAAKPAPTKDRSNAYKK